MERVRRDEHVLTGAEDVVVDLDGPAGVVSQVRPEGRGRRPCTNGCTRCAASRFISLSRRGPTPAQAATVRPAGSLLSQARHGQPWQLGRRRHVRFVDRGALAASTDLGGYLRLVGVSRGQQVVVDPSSRGRLTTGRPGASQTNQPRSSRRSFHATSANQVGRSSP